MNETTTCEARYERLASDRLTFLDRARRCAELTIPTLIPPEAHSKSTTYYTPWQGIGARGVNNLASKLLLSLLPPNSPFFRLVVDDFTLDEIAGRPGARAKVDEGLNKIERAVQTEIEGSNIRPSVFLSLKHLIVAGNVLLYFPVTGGVRVYRLDSYVVKRDPMGNVLEIIAKDEVSPSALTKEEQALLSDPSGQNDDQLADERTVKVYTHLYRKDNKWHLYQSIAGKEVPGSRGQYPIDKSPMLALRWTAIDGEDYGRGYVEEYLGDLISLEGLSKAIVQAAAAAAKVVFLLNPNGVTRMRDVAKAESGDFVVGKQDDVSTVQTDKQADMRIAYEAAKTISERLSLAFLMHSSVQRQAERVTAEEIRFMAAELEDALGGVYSILSQEFQLPLVNRLMDRMVKQKKLPPLPKGVVKPAIVTGLEALGRGHDMNKYNMLLKALQPLGPEVLAQYMNVGDYISRVTTSLGIDAKGLVKDEEQLLAEQQQAQQAQQMQMMQDMAGKLGPDVIKGISNQAMQNKELDAQSQAPQGQ
jgi:hypothetical protein